MSLARGDVRFLLPGPVRSVTLLDEEDGWRSALERAQVEVVGEAGRADLVIAPARSWRAALASGAPGVVLHGRDARARLARAGIPARTYFPMPNAGDPFVVLPLDAPRLTRYVLTRMVAPRTALRTLRNRLLPRLLAPRARVSGSELLTTASAAGITPQLVSVAARELAADDGLDWLLLPGRGDLLARSVLLLFPRGADEPRWAVKFARVRDYTAPFDRDDRGHRVIEAAGPVVAAHAPARAGRFVVDGLHASIETAAPGATLAAYLRGAARPQRKVQALDAIAAWLVAVAEHTAEPPQALAPQLERLGREVVPEWGDAGAGLDPGAELRDVPAVLEHHDLGPWNMAVDGGEFVALDWEAARPHGLPLWDLLYLLTDSLAQLDGVAQELDERETHFAALFRGELDSSRVLFRWIAETVRRLGLRPERVGPIATLCWMEHGLSPRTRQAAIDEHGDTAPPIFGNLLIERLARRWLTDPALGRDWCAWQAT
jgi:hypothetical protein